ncbi:hypothetical protein JAAARDRAFT_199597 [Jaapia argillacea MUCL 33604]|uniref:CCHC-type domain-containing protein n=1 Tax=Jaapia argillacea MUCL 33604 TaxID=933084 RepID=A0A067P7M5_9AGAM|nr:hypothetical protein JAAARDRAFT_199597 [Jaapia argillacea MUCL 33604]
MITTAILHTLTIIITPSIHLPSPPAFYVTADHKVMMHEHIEYCECQLVSNILAQAKLVNTENWILKWKHDQSEEIRVRMGRPRALDFFELDNPIQKQICPVRPVPIITINQPPVLAPLDYTEADPYSLGAIIPRLRSNGMIYEVQDMFGPIHHLADVPPHSPSYHPELPNHSPHPSDYQPLNAMDVDDWNYRADHASPHQSQLTLRVPMTPSPPCTPCPPPHPQNPNPPSHPRKWKPEGGEHEWPPAGLADSEEVWPNPVDAIEQWGSRSNAPFPSPSPSNLWANCPPRYITTDDSHYHRKTKCWNCHKRGHLAHSCPTDRQPHKKRCATRRTPHTHNISSSLLSTPQQILAIPPLPWPAPITERAASEERRHRAYVEENIWKCKLKLDAARWAWIYWLEQGKRLAIPVDPSSSPLAPLYPDAAAWQQFLDQQVFETNWSHGKIGWGVEEGLGQTLA